MPTARRKYESSHPWITFQLDLRRASPKLWLLLGEAQSKIEHLSKVPLKPSLVAQLKGVYMAKGVRGTVAIEGNTLSEEEVSKRVVNQLELPESKEYMGVEVDNVTAILNDIEQGISTDKRFLTVEELLDYNLRLLKGARFALEVIPGEFRQHEVGVMKCGGAPAEDCPFLTAELCKWLNSEDFRPTKQLPFGMTILKAILAHLYIAGIHPFGDGNGRTARMVEFKILVAGGIPDIAAHLLSNFYNETRQAYYLELDQTSKSNGDILPFIEYALQGFVDSLREQIGAAFLQQYDLAWKDYVHELIDEDLDETVSGNKRRRHLVFDLAEAGAVSTVKAIPAREFDRTLRRFFYDYREVSERSVTRDLEMLLDMNLIGKMGTKKNAKYFANCNIVQGFRPRTFQAQLPQ